MKKIFARLCAFTAFLLLCAGVLTPAASAAGPIDTEAACGLTLTFDIKNGEEKAAAVTFKLYRVASVSPGGSFTVTEEFAGQELEEGLAQPDTAVYTAMAAKLTAAVAADDTLLPAAAAQTDETGTVRFTGLQPGLYLVTGEVFHGFETFYTPQNVMVSLPERLSDDSWGYEVTSELKWEKRPDTEPIDLDVINIWSDSASNLHLNDQVTVHLYKDGVLYDTQVLNVENDWQYPWNQVYGGAVWTLTSDPVENYTTTIEREGNHFIVTQTREPEPEPTLPQTGLPLLLVLAVSVAGGICIGKGLRKKKQ